MNNAPVIMELLVPRLRWLNTSIHTFVNTCQLLRHNRYTDLTNICIRKVNPCYDKIFHEEHDSVRPCMFEMKNVEKKAINDGFEKANIKKGS